MLKCADERNVCETKAYKVYGKMYQSHVDECYAVELVVGRHPGFPGSTGGKPPELFMYASRFKTSSRPQRKNLHTALVRIGFYNLS